MQRRDALRLLISGAVLPTLTPEAFALFREAHPSQGYALRTLNAHQNATVVTMSDIIIPETSTPGAKGAKVNEFIDLILTEWATEEERTNFLNGLAGIDKESDELFGKDFVDASPAQQLAQLRARDDAEMANRSFSPRRPTFRDERDTQLKGNFWTVFKGMTLHGYYTSEIGFTQELKLSIIPGEQHGCAPVNPDLAKA
jgi:hypothetical protein